MAPQKLPDIGGAVASIRGALQEVSSILQCEDTEAGIILQPSGSTAGKEGSRGKNNYAGDSQSCPPPPVQTEEPRERLLPCRRSSEQLRHDVTPLIRVELVDESRDIENNDDIQSSISNAIFNDTVEEDDDDAFLCVQDLSAPLPFDNVPRSFYVRDATLWSLKDTNRDIQSPPGGVCNRENCGAEKTKKEEAVVRCSTDDMALLDRLPDPPEGEPLETSTDNFEIIADCSRGRKPNFNNYARQEDTPTVPLRQDSAKRDIRSEFPCGWLLGNCTCLSASDPSKLIFSEKSPFPKLVKKIFPLLRLRI